MSYCIFVTKYTVLVQLAAKVGNLPTHFVQKAPKSLIFENTLFTFTMLPCCTIVYVPSWLGVCPKMTVQKKHTSTVDFSLSYSYKLLVITCISLCVFLSLLKLPLEKHKSLHARQTQYKPYSLTFLFMYLFI